ncbi:DUF3558 domain-containing protein [Nocardia otitidiscaviarum]|nr:DUF3558 family protein [Nocardia otitidiscaviarum]MCP9618907.1 DUF3558 domain-containing protein [Nocardia otitidiscaviarum]
MRRALIVLTAVASIAIATGCSLTYSVEDDEPAAPTGFTSVPACDGLDTMLEASLHAFAGDLYSADSRMQTQYVVNNKMVQGVTCALTMDQPVPRTDSYPAAGPLARSVTIQLSAVGESPTHWTMLRTSATPDSLGMDETSEATPLPGIGDTAILWTGRDWLDAAKARARARISNIDIDVTTSGMNWSGGPQMPVTDSTDLTKDLSEGAEQITAALVRGLQDTLPQKTIGWTLQPGAPEDDDPPATTDLVQVWDPCTLADSAITSAGLDIASKEDRGTVLADSASCRWDGNGFTLDVESTAAQRFTQLIYQHPTHYTGFQPVTVGGRRALRVDSTSHGDTGCMLAFDIPQGVRGGGTVGMVRMQAWASRPSYSGGMGHAAVCDALTGIGEVLAPHLPPGRP